MMKLFSKKEVVALSIFGAGLIVSMVVCLILGI